MREQLQTDMAVCTQSENQTLALRSKLFAPEEIIHSQRDEWHRLGDVRRAIPQLQGVVDGMLSKQAVAPQECRTLCEEVVYMNHA